MDNPYVLQIVEIMRYLDILSVHCPYNKKTRLGQKFDSNFSSNKYRVQRGSRLELQREAKPGGAVNFKKLESNSDLDVRFDGFST